MGRDVHGRRYFRKDVIIGVRHWDGESEESLRLNVTWNRSDEVNANLVCKVADLGHFGGIQKPV